MKGYYIQITNHLLEPKHYLAMDSAVWLFMWLLDKMTSISENGVGAVLGGRPIKFEEVGKTMGISERTYNRWVKRLQEAGYINIKKAPYGLIISVNKAQKAFGQKSKADLLRRPGESLQDFVNRRRPH